jgi:hypothetical protein
MTINDHFNADRRPLTADRPPLTADRRPLIHLIPPFTQRHSIPLLKSLPLFHFNPKSFLIINHLIKSS